MCLGVSALCSSTAQPSPARPVAHASVSDSMRRSHSLPCEPASRLFWRVHGFEEPRRRAGKPSLLPKTHAVSMIPGLLSFINTSGDFLKRLRASGCLCTGKGTGRGGNHRQGVGDPRRDTGWCESTPRCEQQLLVDMFRQ